MQWDNALNAWFTNNYDGTSATVQLTSATVDGIPVTVQYVAMQEIADLSGVQQLPLTEPCPSSDTSPSCANPPFPPETRLLTDEIPIFSLGAFAPHEVKRFDMSFTYQFGDNRTAAPRTSSAFYTVSDIPLPATTWLVGLGLALLQFRGLAGRPKSAQ